MKSVLVTDLGGTKSRAALLDERLHVVAERERRTSSNREQYLADLVADLNELRGAATGDIEPPTAVGVATAGVVRPDRRVVLYAPNLPFGEDFPLSDRLEADLGLPVTVINDGRASAIGEHRFGDARGSDPLLALFFGTGIGIGLVVDGEPYGGAANAAGEVGHTIHVPDGRTCPCGRLGCYEAYCGGRVITERAAAEISATPPAGDRWTVDGVVALRADDVRAAAILAEAERAACSLVASLCTLLNPAVVVLGGGVLKGWPDLPRAIEEFTKERCSATVTRDLRFVPSRGGSDAILWGAAATTGVF